MVAYFNLIAGIFCLWMALKEFAKMKDTCHRVLFWDTFFAGINLLFAAKGFGWL